VIDGRAYQAQADHPNWPEIQKAITDEDFDKAIELLDLEQVIRDRVSNISSDRLEVKEGAIYFDGIQQGPQASDMILNMLDKHMVMDPMLNFLKRLSVNPSYRAREQTLEFVVNNKMPINPDGNFLAYKRIRSDWTDVYTGKISNTIGETVRMPRHDVDDDPNRTCSAGLHVCSQEYLKGYSGDKLVSVVIDPANVVAVPIDYNNTKMRVCEYTILSELPISLVRDEEGAWSSLLVDDDGHDVQYEDEEWEEDEDYSDEDEPAPVTMLAYVVAPPHVFTRSIWSGGEYRYDQVEIAKAPKHSPDKEGYQRARKQQSFGEEIWLVDVTVADECVPIRRVA
jgi:hypothetical protein